MRLCVLLTLAGVTATSWPARADQAMTLRRVMLSQGGVGYFEYDATVDGAATLGLDVPRGAVSDVLKSLVVLDGAGGVDSVELPSAEPGAAALAGLPVPREALGRPLDLLNALQGVTVTVAGAAPMTGRVLHAEPPPELAAGASGVLDPRLGKTRVTLLTDAGLQQFLLEDVVAVQVADPALRAELQAAVAALRGSAATDRRHLSVRVEGGSARTVHLGVVVGAPLWKASYRLMLPAEGAAGPDTAPGAAGDATKARLQGWAVLENAGLADWNGITLTLHSGNPVAFRQAIYQTYFVPRPEVPIDALRHPLPPVDSRAVMASPAPEAAAAPAPMMRMAAPAAGMPYLAPPAATAQTSDNGVATSFTLPQPLTLAAGHSASVPFLDRRVAASRVDLLATGAVHPLAAVRLVNDTGSSLPPGAVTTYGAAGADAIGFTGDARLGPLPAGETRVLSFAQDLATTATWHTDATASVASITAANGVLHITRRERTTTTVDLAAPADAPRRVLVEIPRRQPAARLSTEPKLPVEQTATAWRLDVPLAAGEQRQVVAHADHLVARSTMLDANPETVALVLNEQGLPQTARDALQHLADLVREATARDAARDELDARRTAIEQDESRLRANLVAVPATDPLHGQLLRALGADEDKLATLAASQRDAIDAAVRAHQAVSDAIAGLNL